MRKIGGATEGGQSEGCRVPAPGAGRSSLIQGQRAWLADPDKPRTARCCQAVIQERKAFRSCRDESGGNRCGIVFAVLYAQLHDWPDLLRPDKNIFCRVFTYIGSVILFGAKKRTG